MRRAMTQLPYCTRQSWIRAK